MGKRVDGRGVGRVIGWMRCQADGQEGERVNRRVNGWLGRRSGR